MRDRSAGAARRTLFELYDAAIAASLTSNPGSMMLPSDQETSAAGVPDPAAPVRPEFAVHLLNDNGKQKAAAIADTFSRALNALEVICGAADPRGKGGAREMAIVRTKLEEACFFAKRAMALDPACQQSA